MRRRSFLLGAGSAVFSSGWLRGLAQPSLGSRAYVTRDGLWIQRLSGEKETRLVGGLHLQAPRFSPSGKWISYFEGDALRVVSHDGREKGDLGKTEAGRPELTAQWRPDRDELLATNASGLNVFSPVNGWKERLREMKHISFPVAFSSRGSEVAFGDIVTTERHGAESEPMRKGRLCRLALDQRAGVPK